MTNWEGNTSQPPVQYIPAIIRFLGYDPLPQPASFRERLVAARRARGLTEKQLAIELGIEPNTIQKWERSRRQPSRKKLEGVARCLRIDPAGLSLHPVAEFSFGGPENGSALEHP